MDEKTKTKWVRALRSGKYKQGTGRLRSGSDHYCCLGVLCDITPEVRWERLEPESDSWMARYKDESTACTSLPTGLMDSLHLVWRETDLIYLNDSGATFDEIADWIKENL